MWLLIDDIRDLNCDVIARNPVIGKELLAMRQWKCLCIDHDLGTKETGYDIMKWAVKHNVVPEKVQIVSSNPVGKENIGRLLKDNGYTSIDNVNFCIV
jgi:hypothetical protein